MFDAIREIYNKALQQNTPTEGDVCLPEEELVDYPDENVDWDSWEDSSPAPIQTGRSQPSVNLVDDSSDNDICLPEEKQVVPPEVAVDYGDDPHALIDTKGRHDIEIGHTFDITRSGNAQLFAKASVTDLVGEPGVDNDRLGEITLKRLNDRGQWETVESKPVFRGRFGDTSEHKIGFDAKLKAGTYKVDVSGNQDLRVSGNYTVDFSSKNSELTAATWNMLWTDEPMSKYDWGSATHYTKAMKNAWDADVIFFQEVDKGDRGYDDHHVLNMIDEGLNGTDKRRDWSLTWGYDDRNMINRVNSYLVTNVKRDVWMDPSGGGYSYSSVPGSWRERLSEIAKEQGTDKAKGYFSKEQIEAAGGEFKGNPGDHGQVGNQFLLGEVWNYKYYMNVTKARTDNGEVVYLANIHMKSDEKYAGDRRSQIKKAMHYLKKLAANDPDYDGRVLLAGDFNSYNIKKGEGAELLKIMRKEYGYAVDASMASEFDENPDDYMEKPSDWKEGKPPETWDQVPSFIGRDGSIKGGERYDAFIMLGEGWRNDLIQDFHFAGPKEFEVHRTKDFIPDGPGTYNYGRPVADTDHLPGRINLSIGKN